MQTHSDCHESYLDRRRRRLGRVTMADMLRERGFQERHERERFVNR